VPRLSCGFVKLFLDSPLLGVVPALALLAGVGATFFAVGAAFLDPRSSILDPRTSILDLRRRLGFFVILFVPRP